MVNESASDALVILSRASTEASRDLERQVTGDLEAVAALSRQMELAIETGNEELCCLVADALGGTGLAAARPALERALDHDWGEDLSAPRAIVHALANIAQGLSLERQKADTAILDRADVKTAAKGTVFESGSKRVVHDLSGLPADLLRLIADAGEPGGVAGGGQGGTEPAGSGRTS
jgi:hypothetical protein